MYRSNPVVTDKAVNRIFDLVSAALANSNLGAYDAFVEGGTFYRGVIREALEKKAKAQSQRFYPPRKVKTILEAKKLAGGAEDNTIPFRAPHHTVSTKGIRSELELAQGGVLHLEDLGEFPRTTLHYISHTPGVIITYRDERDRYTGKEQDAYVRLLERALDALGVGPSKTSTEKKKAKAKPKPKPKPKAKPKRASRRAAAKIGVQKRIEIRDLNGEVLGAVDLPLEAKGLADFVGETPGLSFIAWESIPQTLEKQWGATGESAFLAATWNSLGIVTTDLPAPEHMDSFGFSPEEWKEAFTTGRLTVRSMYEKGDFPSVNAVIPDRQGRSIRPEYSLERQAVGKFRGERLKGKVGDRPTFVFRHSYDAPITYRYLPKDAGFVSAELVPYRKMDVYQVVTSVRKDKPHFFNAGLMEKSLGLVGGGGTAEFVSVHMKGPLDVAVITGMPSSYVLLMPMRSDESVSDTAPFEPVTHTEPVPSCTLPTPEIVQTNPGSGALVHWIKKLFDATNDTMLSIGAVMTPSGPERWITRHEFYYPGVIRLPLAEGPIAVSGHPQQLAFTLKLEDLIIWLRALWPTTQPIWRRDPFLFQQTDIKDLCRQLDGNWARLDAPVLRGMDALVSDNPNRYGLTHVGLTREGNTSYLLASDGHKGLIASFPASSEAWGRPGESPFPDSTVGLSPLLFQGFPVWLSSTHGASGHIVAEYERPYNPPDMIGVFLGTHRQPRHTLELTDAIIRQILRFPVKKVNKGEPLLVASRKGFEILYVLDYTERIRQPDGTFKKEPRTKIVGSTAFVSDLPSKLENFPEDVVVSFRFFKEVVYAMSAEPGAITLELPVESSRRPWYLRRDDLTGLVMGRHL